MRLMSKLLLSLLLAIQVSACVPVVVGGAAAGGAMVADRRTTGAYIDDEAIENKAEKQVNDNLGVANIHINVTSFNRNVLMTGEVIDEAGKAKAERIVRALDNVRSVTNELVVDEKSKLTERNQDAFITSKVKARLVKENRFPANYVKVVTEAGVVYLMGMVTRQEAADAVDIASTTSDVQKVVKVFEYLD
jgi:osmotically-inducible protein OsmY